MAKLNKADRRDNKINNRKSIPKVSNNIPRNKKDRIREARLERIRREEEWLESMASYEN